MNMKENMQTNKIFVINMAKSIERKANIIKQFKKYNITNYEFIEAIDGDLLTTDLVPLNETRNASDVGEKYVNHFSNREIACIQSHLKAINKAIELNLEYVIILEDDVVLCEDWNLRLAKIMKIIPKNWQHIFLAGLPNAIIKDAEGNGYVKFLRVEKSISTMGAFAYILRNDIYENIKIELEKLITTIDNTIDLMLLDNKLISYTVYPFMVYHDNYVQSTLWDKKYIRQHKSFKYFANKI